MLKRRLYKCTVKQHLPLDFFITDTAHQALTIMLLISN